MRHPFPRCIIVWFNIYIFLGHITIWFIGFLGLDIVAEFSVFPYVMSVRGSTVCAVFLMSFSSYPTLTRFPSVLTSQHV